MAVINTKVWKHYTDEGRFRPRDEYFREWIRVIEQEGDPSDAESLTELCRCTIVRDQAMYPRERADARHAPPTQFAEIGYYVHFLRNSHHQPIQLGLQNIRC